MTHAKGFTLRRDQTKPRHTQGKIYASVVAGEIKAGKGTLIGNAGEFYVAAELLKRGIVAALAPRNAPSIDMTATKGSKTVRIRVKTKSEKPRVWQWVVKKDGRIFRDISKKGDFTVLVNLTKETKNLEYFVVPTHVLDKWLKADFSYWLNTPGRDGPHSPDNTKRHLSYDEKTEERLKPYRGNWNLLWR